MANIFFEEIEQTAITRIQKFAKIAAAYNFEIAVGFSGGKDSQVVHDLCKRAGIPFKAYYNVAFESATTKRFIRDNYPDVIWRRDYKVGFIENIYKMHGGLLPTVEKAYCCADCKHNPKYVDKCSITGVRRQESSKRATRTALSFKNKSLMKQMLDKTSEYFVENCQSVGTASVIQLLPIVDWSDADVWDYILRHRLPVNGEYAMAKRVGCLVCPKANFSYNYKSLIRYPKLIDAFIRAREKASCDWMITSDNKDYSDDKVYYICRWLNHSFRPFTKRQMKEYESVKQTYLNSYEKEYSLCTRAAQARDISTADEQLGVAEIAQKEVHCEPYLRGL